MKRVLVAGLVHETHTFLAERTGLERFGEVIWRHGQEVLAAGRGDLSPMGGVLQVADENGWKLYPSQYGAAMPSGTVEDAVLERWWERVGADLSQALNAGLDGIVLVLHGALVFESFPDGEGEILRRVRQALGGRPVPIAADLDLHANFSPEMARHGSIFTGYRCNPHTDAREAGERAARLLQRVLERGERPRVALRRPGVIYSPKGTSTDAEPMLSLQRMARGIEEEHAEILEVCVLPGFSYADVPCAGVSFCATTVGEPDAALALLEPLAAEARRQAEAGNPVDPPVDEVMPLALQAGPGPIGLIEPSDNIGGGTPGDGTGVLQALLQYGVEDAAVVINDPQAAGACHGVGVGERLRLPVGGKVDAHHGPTLDLDLELLHLSDGRFELENPNSHLASLVGRHVDMGPCAVARHRGVRVLLTSLKTPPMDLGQLRSQGIEPEGLRMVGIKAAISHKAAYDPILRASFYVDTPGMGSSDLRRFPYRHIPRPILPLDG